MPSQTSILVARLLAGTTPAVALAEVGVDPNVRPPVLGPGDINDFATMAEGGRRYRYRALRSLRLAGVQMASDNEFSFEDHGTGKGTLSWGHPEQRRDVDTVEIDRAEHQGHIEIVGYPKDEYFMPVVDDEDPDHPTFGPGDPLDTPALGLATGPAERRRRAAMAKQHESMGANLFHQFHGRTYGASQPDSSLPAAQQFITKAVEAVAAGANPSKVLEAFIDLDSTYGAGIDHLAATLRGDPVHDRDDKCLKFLFYDKAKAKEFVRKMKADYPELDTPDPDLEDYPDAALVRVWPRR